MNSPSFLSSLSAFLSSLQPPVDLPEEVMLEGVPLPVNLYSLYRWVTHCGGVEEVESQLGWSLVLNECGIKEELQVRGCEEAVKAVWKKFLQPMWEAVRRGGVEERKEEEEEEEGVEVSTVSPPTPPQGMEVEGTRKRKRGGEVVGESALSSPSSSPPPIRRSGRDRKLRPSSAALSVLSAFSAASQPFIESVCTHCEQFDHHTSKVRCIRCSLVYHAFCLSPPLSSPPPSTTFICRPCVEKDQGEFGFEAGGFYSLSQFKRKADAFKASHFHRSPTPPSAISAEFWRIVRAADATHPITVEYGSDLDTQEVGSVFPSEGAMASDEWNLNLLPRLSSSILTLLDDVDIEGISIPWLYVGMLFSAFCWHNEDHYSYSINYVSEGEDKQWYGVGSHNAATFERVISQALPHLFTSTPDLLFHLITMMDPTLFPSTPSSCSPLISQVVQHAGEIVITFPQAYHCGFNHGFNVAESVNFAPHDWLPFGLQCSVRYRYFHRQPVWCCEQLVLSVAEQVTAEPSERTEEERRLSEEAAEARGELPLWERAAWLYPALRRLRDEEHRLRRALYASGSTRMQPWGTTMKAAPQYKQGDHIRFPDPSAQRGEGDRWRQGVVLNEAGEGWWAVKSRSDGVVVQVEGHRMQRVVDKEEQRTHDWREYQNFGEEGPVQDKESRMARTSRMGPASPPTSSLPRCLVCRHFLYLSSVQCSCTVDKFACLSHSAHLCECVAQSKFALFRHSLAQLDELTHRVARILGLEEGEDEGEVGTGVRRRAGAIPSPRPPFTVHHPHASAITSIVQEGELILSRCDDHVTDTERRMARLYPTGTSPHRSATTRSSQQWDERTESTWCEGAEQWLRSNEPFLLHLQQPTLTLPEVSGILKEGERFIWGDGRMSPHFTLYSTLTTWHTQATLHSMQLCSLVCAHRLLQSRLAALQEALPYSLPWQNALTALFRPTSPIPGLLSLEDAKGLREAHHERKGPLHLPMSADRGEVWGPEWDEGEERRTEGQS